MPVKEDEGYVVKITGETRNMNWIQPIDVLWQQATLKRLKNNLILKYCHPTMGEIIDSNPCGIFKMKGDGNCFFRAVSYALVGDHEQHEITRQIITEWMTKNKVKIDNNFGSEYLNESRMEEDGMWATEAEILATAALL